MRGGFVFLANDADDLGQLFHQVGTVLQAACGVDHQQIGTVFLCACHGIEGKACRIRSLGRGQDRYPGAFAPNLQLFDSGGAERVARRDHHFFASRLELACQFANRGGLSGTVDAHDQHHLWALGIDRHGFGHRLHDTGNLLRQQLLDLIGRELLAETPLGHVRGDAQGCVDAHV